MYSISRHLNHTFLIGTLFFVALSLSLFSAVSFGTRVSQTLFFPFCPITRWICWAESERRMRDEAFFPLNASSAIFLKVLERVTLTNCARFDFINDRTIFTNALNWIYNDVEVGWRAFAETTQKRIFYASLIPLSRRGRSCQLLLRTSKLTFDGIVWLGFLLAQINDEYNTKLGWR